MLSRWIDDKLRADHREHESCGQESIAGMGCRKLVGQGLQLDLSLSINGESQS
jgi:hypothetical protein